MDDFNSGRQAGVRSSDTSGAPVRMNVREFPALWGSQGSCLDLELVAHRLLPGPASLSINSLSLFTNSLRCAHMATTV
jgi:hypothetical protein